MTDAEVINELQAGIKLLKQERYKLKEEIDTLKDENEQMKDFIEGTDNEEAYQQWITCNKE